MPGGDRTDLIMRAQGQEEEWGIVVVRSRDSGIVNNLMKLSLEDLLGEEEGIDMVLDSVIVSGIRTSLNIKGD